MTLFGFSLLAKISCDSDYIFQTRDDEISFDDIRKVGEGWCGTTKTTDSV